MALANLIVAGSTHAATTEALGRELAEQEDADEGNRQYGQASLKK
jgi:hypothetical protein